VRRVAAALGLAAALVVLLATPASAHAGLVSTTPAAGAVLDRAPDAAVVRFDQVVQVRADGLRLYDRRGRRVDDGGVARVDGGRSVRLPLPGLADGGYVLTWRVVSADGHPLSGGVTWRVGSGAPVDQGVLAQVFGAEDGDATVRAVAAVVRGLLFAGLVVLAGGALFVAFVWPGGSRRARPLLRAGAGVTAVATVVGMGVQGADVAGLSLADAVRPSLAWDTVAGSYGEAALARLALVALFVLVLERRPWRPVVAIIAVLSLGTVTWAGHARTGRWVAAAVPLDVAHLAAGALWLGGLVVVVVVVLRRLGDDEAVPVAARFSPVAAACVAVVVATGTVQSWRQLGSLAGFQDTTYGRLLVVKVVLVAVVVVLGAMSRSRLRAGDRSLRSSVRAEAVLGVTVLAVTSLLVAADPARTVEARAWDGERLVQGTVLQAVAAPARTGPVDFHVYVSDPTLGLTTRLAVAAELALPGKGITEVEVPLAAAGRGHWAAYDVDVPITGTWHLEVVLTVGELDQRRTMFEIPIH
jgi:copper transport protein